MSNIIQLKRKPSPFITDEPITECMPTTLQGKFLAMEPDASLFVAPQSYPGWLDSIQFRGGLAKEFTYEDEGDDCAVVLNNCCRMSSTGIHWRMNRRAVVLTVLEMFKGSAYVEFHPEFTGITLWVKGYSHESGRSLNHRWVEVIDYNHDEKAVPLTGYKLANWSVDEPLNCQAGLDDLYDLLWEPEGDDDETEADAMMELLIAERNRLRDNLDSSTTSKSLLNDQQYFGVVQALLEFVVEEGSYMPFRLLDGFIDEPI